MMTNMTTRERLKAKCGQKSDTVQIGDESFVVRSLTAKDASDIALAVFGENDAIVNSNLPELKARTVCAGLIDSDSGEPVYLQEQWQEAQSEIDSGCFDLIYKKIESLSPVPDVKELEKK